MTEKADKIQWIIRSSGSSIILYYLNHQNETLPESFSSCTPFCWCCRSLTDPCYISSNWFLYNTTPVTLDCGDDWYDKTQVLLNGSERMSQISGPQTASKGGLKWYFTEILIYFITVEDLHSSIMSYDCNPSHHYASSRLIQKLFCAAVCLPWEVVGQINPLYSNNLQAQTLFLPLH